MVSPPTGTGTAEWEDWTPTPSGAGEEPTSRPGPVEASVARPGTSGAGRPVVSERPMTAADRRWLEDRPPHWG